MIFPRGERCCWARFTTALAVSLPAIFCALTIHAADSPEKSIIHLRAWGVPEHTRYDVNAQALLEIMEAFQKKYPHIRPVSTTGLEIPGRTMDVAPLMQIAGNIAPDVMYVNFRQSDTYIRNKFLYPLDKYIEQTVGARIKDGHLLSLEDYLAQLKRAPRYKQEIEERIPRQTWDVMRRACPYGEKCPHLKQWGEPPAQEHAHVWMFPEGPLVTALFFRRDLFHEAGLPDRAPETTEEMFEWAKKLTNPKENRYGLRLTLGDLGWSTASFLYSMGGRLVDQDKDGNWRCVFDSEEAVEAYYFVARLFWEKYKNEHGEFTGVVYLGEETASAEIKTAMFFSQIDQKFFAQFDPAQWGFGATPRGPTGLQGGEFNSRMCGIYAGLETDEARRDAAWAYIHFYDGPEAQLIVARKFVENGFGQYVRPHLLEKAGYPEYIRQVPKGWEEAYQLALATGVPEPYGKNCQMIYRFASKALDQIRTDATVKSAIQRGDAETAKARIREILKDRVARSNEKLMNIIPPDERAKRNRVAVAVALGIFLVFVLVFRHVFKVFARSQITSLEERKRGQWQFTKYKWAYLLILPALGSIALWSYYPLARGTIIAFQDYNVRGFSEWVGMENFANVLYDDEFWYAMWVALKYTLMYVAFGFFAPIALAFLLTEVPRGKILFRTIYYLPAVLSGVVVIYLWKGFYGAYGMINQVLNFFIGILNYLPGIEMAPVTTAWLESPSFALFFCLLPTIWAGMGPGCLIYLAALKTIPEENYEAADVDGASITAKVFHIAIPSIKSLILINFIGAIIGVMHSGGGMILAMTGGGPYAPYGETEVVGLHIFWQAFAYLRFGPATAMAWVLGSMLIGFTVLQLQRLSRLEFKAAGGTET